MNFRNINQSSSINKPAFTVLAAFVIFFMLFIPPAYAGQGVVSGSVVNVRSGPGSDNEIIGTLLKDTQVEILQNSGGWYKIKFSNLQGWVAGDYISTTSNASTTGTTITAGTSSRQIQAVNGPVNVRSGPGTSYPVLDTIEDQETYKVQGEKDGWFKIQLSDGTTAYAASWLVQEQGSAAVTTSSGQTTTTVAAGSKTTTSSGASAVNNAAPTVILNQKTMQFEVPPSIENGRTLVPLRAIFEAMGASVEWDESTRTVTSRCGSTTVVLPLGSTSPTVNGQIWKLDVPAKIKNGRTLAPLRFVGEAFGGKVNWDEGNRVITINYETTKQPEAVKVTEPQVNLRQAPSTSAAKIDTALQGETLVVLAAKDGWYQVTHGSITAWVASWVVEAASLPEETDPEPPTPDSSDPSDQNSDNEPQDALHLSRTREADGIRVVISSDVKMDPDIEQKSGSVSYKFSGRKVAGLYYFEEPIGSQILKTSAVSQGEDTVVNVTFPGYLEYSLDAEDNGKKLVVFIPNTILSIESSAFGSVGDRFIVTTICPVKATGKINGDKLEVSIPNVKLKKGTSGHYDSELVNSLKADVNPSRTNDVLITFDTNELGKYSFAASGSSADLNIILMKKIAAPVRSAVVVLDAGHGGRDAGACGSQLQEKEANLAVVSKLGSLLEQAGIKVVYTRSDDSYVDLGERSVMANELNAQLFVSVHCNSSTQSAPNGTETYFYAPLENPDLFIQREERSDLARLIQTEMIEYTRRTDRGVKEANFSVLRETNMPCALVEMAFISNSDEQALLMDDNFREQAARAIANGIEQYINSHS